MKDQKILAIYLTFGLLIIVGYTSMIKNYKPALWSNNNKNVILKIKPLKYIYFAMIFICSISSIYLIYYLTDIEKSTTDEILIYTGSVIFLVFSTVWAFFPYTASVFVLACVAIGTILILAGIGINQKHLPADNKKILALVAATILVIQTSVFDFGIWNGLVKFGIK